MTTVQLDNPRGRELGRFVQCLALSRGDVLGASRVAEAKGWTATLGVFKQLVDPILSGQLDHGVGAVVATDLAELLRPLTLVGRLQGMRKVPFRTTLLVTDVGGTGDWVEEGEPIPVSATGITNLTSLDPKRVAGIRVITAELARSAAVGAPAMVARDSASALVEALDRAFVDPANGGSAAKPASINNAATAFSSGGSDVAAIDNDLRLMLGTLLSAEMSLATASWVMSPVTSTYLSLLRGSSGAPAYPGVTARGGQLLGLPILTSNACAASGSPGERHITLVEASEVCIADDGEADVSLSSRGAVQMDDAPATGAQQLVSLWQLGLVGIRAARFINWQVRRSGAVATLRDVNF
ncbi:phage major capsid protein [Piscinibacter sp.]|uniref:phage major capsid protein n=1 Tax=Piscinibacter sp. TaxID=1903157 RepID=UPI002CFB10ED|nr:phage major capsid protein [Albitalea sp.]HUG21464.1 phage major capsid protein [Albitalea sp.]